MAKATPATMALQRAGVSFVLHENDYDPNAARIGMQAAEALGVAPARLLKTRMTRAGDVTCVLLPSRTGNSISKGWQPP
jgi:Cys-tRNA(Pro)/Cys-tRNA(Cys) deacylase